MHVSSLILAAASLLAPAAQPAQPAVTVAIRVDPRPADAFRDITEPIKFTLTARPVDPSGRFGEPVTVPQCKLAEDCSFAVPPGLWILSIEGADLYVPIKTINAGAESLAATALFAYRTAPLAGTVDPRPTSDVKLIAGFHRDETSTRPALSGDVYCPIAPDGQWRCDVPTGVVDVSLHVPGFISFYSWDTKIETGKTVQMGTITLRQGASLVGYVDVARGAAPSRIADALVQLSPVSAPAAVTPTVVRPNAKGFFHFDAVPPGQYSLVAKHPQLTSLPVTVRIIERREADLREHLVLQPKRTIELLLTPALDPTLKPWRVELDANIDTAHRTVVTESAASPSGEWTARDVRAGSYSFVVKDSNGSAFVRREIDVNAGDLKLDAQLPIAPLRGTVRLGDKPIAAKLTFTNQHVPGVTVLSDDQGTFHGFLPIADDSTWTVSVRSDPFFVNRELRNVTLHKNDTGADVDLQVLATHLSGSVVDEAGKPAGRGIVTITTTADDQPFTQADVQQTGEFILNGLPPGQYQLRVDTYDAQESDTVPVEMAADESPQPLRIVVRPQRDIQGLLYADTGPIVGAKVWAVPTEAQRLMYFPRTTDANGRFTFRLPGGAHECDFLIDAPGFPARIFHARVEGSRFAVHIDQTGGELKVKAPAPKPDVPDMQPYLVHDGAAIQAFMLGRPDASGNVSYALEAGQWLFCTSRPDGLPALRAGQSAGRCVSTLVSPFGSAHIDASKL
jgi:Carboxypeptidase regulatory-like domain